MNLWRSREELAAHWQAEKRFEPRMAAADRQGRMARWRSAVTRARGWARPDAKSGRTARPGRLRSRWRSPGKLEEERSRASRLPHLPISSRERGDLIMLGIGGFTPLEGFMTHADWEGVCARYQTASGVFWPIPITLSSHEPVSGEVALIDAENGETLATMNVVESYKIDKQRECQAVFRTTDAAHPGVAMVMGQGDYNLAGPVKVLSEGGFKAKYGALFMTPRKRARSSSGLAGRAWRHSRRVTRCSARTSTSSRCATACSCTHCSAI